jgi:hypothetical protein
MQSADPFRVRPAGSQRAFEVIDITRASAEQIERAVGFAVGLSKGRFVLRKVTVSGSAVGPSSIVAGFHDGLCGPHEAIPVDGLWECW